MCIWWEWSKWIMVEVYVYKVRDMKEIRNLEFSV